MIFKLRFGKWRLTITLAPVYDIIGVNSLLETGEHILMWDFDDVPYSTVAFNLATIQYIFDLPNIYILNTGKPNNYIAYCFKRFLWELARAIVGMTPDICENFYKWGVFRHRFTLRVSRKGKRRPRLFGVIQSNILEDVSIKDLKSWVQYETLQDGAKGAFINLGKRH